MSRDVADRTAETIEAIAEAFEVVADRIERVLEREGAGDMSETVRHELARLVRQLKGSAAAGVRL